MACLLLWLLYLSLLVHTLCASIRYITYVNSVYNGGICYTISSAIFTNVGVEILGLGTLENHQIAKLLEERNASKVSSKVYAVFWYLHRLVDTNNKTFADNDIIVFFDGADTLHINHNNRTTETLIDSFLKLERPHSIIFSAERNCHPRHPSTICNELNSRNLDVISNQSSFRFVNSGGWIARYNVAIRFIDKWIELMEEQQGKRDDQLAIHDYILRKDKNSSFLDIDVVLDRHCSIFQTSHLTAFSMGDWYAPNYDVMGPFMRADGIIYNSETATFPLFLHFNGIKFFMPQVLKIMTYALKTKAALDSNTTTLPSTGSNRSHNDSSLTMTMSMSRSVATADHQLCAFYEQNYPILRPSCMAKNISFGC